MNKLILLTTFGLIWAGAAVGEPLRIALGSCNDQREDQAVWTQIGDAKPDLFLFLGDNIYGDQYRDAPGVAGLKRAYGLQAMSEPYQAFARSVPIYPIWDDHDYGLNDAGVELPFKEAAKAELMSFFDFPQEAEISGRDGVYYAFTQGVGELTVQFIMLDTRWNRSPLKTVPRPERTRRGKYIDDDATTKTILGRAQWDWLEAELRKPADLRLIASSIQILADGHHYERWGNLTAERNRLFALLNSTEAKGVILLSGDRHLGGLYRRDDILDYPLYELTASSLNRGGFALADEGGPHQLSSTYGGENFGLIEVDPDAGTLAITLNRAEDGKPVRGLTLSINDLR